jgi:large repetitive protein
VISLKYYISFIVTVLAFQGFSQLIQPFNARYSTSQKGGIRILSNVSVSCNSGSSCTSATSEIPPSGTNSNGGFTMNYVDLDGLSSTFMSSSDSLNLLNCSEILWAGLYWSGRATSSVTNWNLRNQVKIRVGNGAYQNLSADELVNAQSLGTHPSYHCFKNITSIVQAAGIKARFTVANVVTQTGGSNYWGGWSIIVVYKNVFQSMRNLTVFDGFGNVSAGSSLDIPISGFATPPSGPVGFELGVIAFEGDRGSTGDQLQFNGAGTFVNVSDAMHNTTDFFNSTISYGAVLTPFRIPSLNNSLGYDASIFLPNNSSFNFIGNNATSATIRVTTSSENILARAFTSAIDIYEPDLRADVRINDLNGGLVAPGDILEYTLVGKNIGSDLSLNTFMVDTLDPRTVYIPNSISYTFGSNNGVKTDLTGDDQAEYNAVNKTLKFRIGTGANNAAGGQVPASSTGADSTVVKFRVQVINDCLMFQCDSTLSHVAYIYGTGNISGNSYNNGGASDTYDANGCPSEASNVLLIDVSGCPPPTIGFNPPVCVGESLVLTASFSAAANYAWTGPLLISTNGNTQTITNAQVASSGQYNVHITFPGLNCSLDTSVAVVIHPNPILNLDSLKNVTCFNAANGKIYVSASSGTPVYQYQWTPGNLAGPSITNLAPGNYTVIVSDVNTCTATATYTITQPTALSALASITSNYNGRNISCFGASDGSASVSYSGGTAPYLINWSPGGATTPSISNLGPGTYTATITDANGCIKTSSVTLTQPTVLTSSHTQVNVSCFGGSDGSINLSNGGGTPGYTYSWSNGATTQDISGLSSATYSVIIADLNGCTKSHSVSITQPAAPLSLTQTRVNVKCFGNSTGSIDLTVAGGTSPYSYSWSSGQTTQDISNLVAGNYTVIVTDSKGCTATLAVSVSQPLAPLSAQITPSAVLCFGGNSGSINLIPAGGTSPYSFLWSNSAVTEDLTALTIGNYSVQIKDANNCLFTISTTITQPSAPLSLTLSMDEPDCFGGLDGNIDVSISGGTIPYAYLWNNGALTEDLPAVGSGFYQVTVTDLNGCIIVGDTVITEPAPVSLMHSQVDVLCYGNSTGAINLMPNGGTAPYTFLWSNGSTQEDLTNIPAGIYLVTVTDNHGCQANRTINVQQPIAPLTLTETHTDAVCVGGLQGTIDLTVTDGTGPYTYNWNNNQTIEDIQNLVAGTYTCVVTDNHLCFDTISVAILDPSNTLVLTTSHTDVSCFGGSNGFIDLSVSGGTPSYTYSWSNGQVGQDATGLIQGNYFVIVTDANTCQSFISVLVDEPDSALTATAVITDVLCFGQLTGSIQITTSGGTAPYSYSWSNGATTEDLSTIAAGTYSLIITDANGCQFSFSTIIYQPLDLVIGQGQVDVDCFSNSTGSIDITPAGGVGNYQYSWSNLATTQDLTNLIAGNYTVTLTDGNNCTTSSTITINQPTAIVSLASTVVPVSCFGGNNGSINITASGGNGNFTYNWSNSSAVEDQYNLSTGNYTVTATDFKGCSATQTYTVTQPALALTTQISMTPVICFSQANATATVTAFGGTAGYTYLWSNGQTAQTAIGLVAGNYSVVVTDVNNCQSTANITVTQPNLLTVNLNPTNVLCYGNASGSISSSVQGGVLPYTYAWSNLAITPGISNLIAGQYSIIVTDANGCLAYDTTQINQPLAPLTYSLATTNNLCFGAALGTIDLSVFGGTSTYNYSWSNTQNTPDLANLIAGNYQVVISDANGCQLLVDTTIYQPTQIQSTALMSPVKCFGGSDGFLNITVSGGIAPYMYLWSNGQTTQDIDSLSTGSYSVQITDSNGCIRNFTYAVSQPAQPITLSLTQTNVACFGESTASINLTVAGGTPTYSYSWSNGQSTQDIFALDTGIYQVIVTDINNCQDSISTLITQPAEPIQLSESHQDILCFGAATGSIDLSVSGGTPIYSYNWSNNQQTEDISTLVAGNYQVVVTDLLGCDDTLVVSLSQPQEPIDVTFTIENVNCFGDSTGTLEASIFGGTAPYQFSWSTTDSTLFIDSLPIGVYAIQVIDSTSCTYIETAIIFQPAAPLNATYSTIEPQCFGYSDGQLILNTTGGTPGYQYNWSTNDSTSTIDSIPTGNYSVQITDANGCIFDLACFLDQPAQILPSFDSDILVGCSPLVVEFFNTSDADFNCAWTFGDSLSYTGCDDVIITFDTGGVYDVNLIAYDANGCFNDVTYNNYITVNQTPSASFTADPTVLFPESPNTTILNTSIGGDFYIWNMGVGDPDEMYFEPGDYQFPANIADTFMITLYAVTTEGCADTAYQQILFNNDPFYYIPNTFIPDGDNTNDVWLPIFSNLNNIKKYRVQVFNRWGELVFETTDPSKGWDGNYLGNNCQDGTYTWKMQFTWYDYRVYNKAGHVNLLR